MRKETKEWLTRAPDSAEWMAFGAVAAFLTMLMLGSCATKIEVQSDTSWTGAVNNASVTGQGNKTFELNTSRDRHACWVFQKDTDTGFLKVRNKGWTSGDEPTTDAPYGVVAGCSE